MMVAVSEKANLPLAGYAETKALAGDMAFHPA
jgi:hypothetical protein